ncbi:alpha-1,2-fucosyltransferase [uncultured Phascolarctobacterium sp.]|uniref:alpha-1,2-fucosyltransferase n=1 Tax=uncultured Phascolarctobacterium sp. TaxID=512296 RepID=UPI0025CC5E8F|nr:alpha-1,2-fucosyltransferase [uncultured Phascolarctobacterium sp.]
MIIVKIMGGFASQIGKLNFGLAVSQKLKTNLGLEIEDFVKGYFRPLMLEYLQLEDYSIFTDVDETKFTKVTNGKELLKCVESGKKDIYIAGEECEFEDFYVKNEDLRINYHSPIFKNLNLKSETTFLKKFRALTSEGENIAVHVRCGDFIDLGWNDDIDNYKKAIGYILSEKSGAKVFLFSNDIEYVKKMFGGHKNFFFMDHHNGALGDLEEFFCMSMCQHVILSSASGFGKYAAFLGKRNNIETKIYALKQLNIKDIIFLGKEQFDIGERVFSSLPKDAIHDLGEKNDVDRHNPISNYLKENTANKITCNKLVDKKMFIITNERISAVELCTMELLTMIFKELGSSVFYVNLNYKTKNALVPTEIGKVTDWDGISLGFDGINYKDRFVDIDNLIKKYNPNTSKENILIISDILLKSSVPYIKFNNNKVATNKMLRYYLKNLFTSKLGMSFTKNYKNISLDVKNTKVLCSLNDIKSEATIYDYFCFEAFELTKLILAQYNLLPIKQ